METLTGLRNAIIYFSDIEHCREFMVELRWPDGKVQCPRCKSEHVLWIAKERVWKCYGKHDHAKFSLKTGTIFEDSPIPLEKWLPAAWLIINCKNGISSYEVSRDLGVTQKSAWFMMHRVRLAMQSGTFEKLSGEVEADETFIGGKARNMHASKKVGKGYRHRGIINKTIVMGMLERGGKVRTQVLQDREQETLHSQIRACIEEGTSLYTDEWRPYTGLSEDYVHQVINHAEKYVDGRVHTNGMENFWSLLKRSLTGTYVSVEPFHLFRYLDEQSFRFNERKSTDAERFVKVMKQIVGRRLTFDQLTGKADKPQLQMRPQ